MTCPFPPHILPTVAVGTGGGGDPDTLSLADYGTPVLDGTNPDGVNDTVLAAALAAWYAAGGGRIMLPPGVLRLDAQVVIPNDGGGIPKQPPLHLQGAGCRFDGTWDANGPLPGMTVLDLRYAGAGEKVRTHGLGLLSANGIDFADLGTSTNPYLKTTNTTLHLSGVSFTGNPSKIRRTCNQDAIILGGTGTTVGGGDEAPFQGYGTVIEKVFFSRVRRGILFQSYANAIVVRDNTWSNSCGAAAGQPGAGIEFDGNVGGAGYSVGNVVTANLFECNGYDYAVRGDYVTNTSFLANNFYDPGAGLLAYYRFEGHAQFNLVIDGYSLDANTLVSEHASSAGTNTVLTAHQAKLNIITGPYRFSSDTGSTFKRAPTLEGVGGVGILSQPTGDPADTQIALLVKRSATAASAPGQDVVQIRQSGAIILTSPAGVAWQVSPTGFEATGAGGTLRLNSGSGGSNIDLRAFAARLMHYTSNTELVRFRISPQSATQGAVQYNVSGPIDTAGAGTPEAVVSAPVGSTFRRTDGGAGTCFYVKESGGTGNTGWIPK